LRYFPLQGLCVDFRRWAIENGFGVALPKGKIQLAYGVVLRVDLNSL
jgi:hypothetical protein